MKHAVNQIENHFGTMLKAMCLFAFVTGSTGTYANWEVATADSVVNFVSIKNGSVAETHRFDGVVGVINDAGIARVAIDLDSVDTMIGIRDERMRELLFETGKYPVAELEAVIDPQVLVAVADGGVATMELPVTVSLHGVEKTVPVALVAASEGKGRMRVMTSRPVLINAADFALVGGIAALQKVAGLKSIATAVPVTFQLVFVTTP